MVTKIVRHAKKRGSFVKALWKGRVLLSVILAILLSFYVTPVHSADEQQLKPRVPADKLAEVKGLKNPVPVNNETLSEAGDIYMGKGVCSTCHGETGRGDGPAGASFNPPPRNFTDVDWQKARTDGEVFWAISKGTEYGMIAFEDMLSAEERWMLVNYIRGLRKSGTDSK